VAAQARLPVTVPGEMLGSFMPGAAPEAVRQRLAERIGDYGAGAGEIPNNEWLSAFQTAFASGQGAEELITFDNIALALGEYQRSMIFVNTPWKAYVEGNDSAISDLAKQGALLFYGDLNPGLECDSCHGGDFFTDERATITGFPQIGIGKGDGTDGDHDFGREQQTADSNDRFAFRNPTLLNVLTTGPYTHSGAYAIDMALTHYFIPQTAFDLTLPGGSVCGVEQFADDPACATLFPNAAEHSTEALAAVTVLRTTDPDRTFPDLFFSPPGDGVPLFTFLETLTDPCTADRACLAPWIPEPDEAPDGNQLNAVDVDGNPL
jgi:cytochrome c peroxidase